MAHRCLAWRGSFRAASLYYFLLFSLKLIVTVTHTATISPFLIAGSYFYWGTDSIASLSNFSIDLRDLEECTEPSFFSEDWEDDTPFATGFERLRGVDRMEFGGLLRRRDVVRKHARRRITRTWKSSGGIAARENETTSQPAAHEAPEPCSYHQCLGGLSLVLARYFGDRTGAPTDRSTEAPRILQRSSSLTSAPRRFGARVDQE
jgi:hypothetical protein